MRRISLLLLFTFLTVSFLQAQDEGTAADASAEEAPVEQEASAEEAPVEQEAPAEAVAAAADEVAPAGTAKAPGSRLFQKICSFFHPLFQ